MFAPLARVIAKQVLAARASVAVLLGRTHTALAHYERIAALDPRDAHAACTAGTLRTETGDVDGAVRAFDALTQARPDYAVGWFNLGFLHDARQHDSEAERCFRAALALDPSLDRAWYGLGLVLARTGRLDDAVMAFRRATRLQPYAPYGWCQLALALHRLGRADEAQAVRAELDRIEPRYAEALAHDLARTPGGAAHA